MEEAHCLFCFVYRHGEPREGNRHPSMYIRRYPEWALSKEETLRRAGCVDNRVVCEMVAHMAQYLNPMEAARILAIIRPADCQVVVEPTRELCSSIIKMDKEETRGILMTVAERVPAGKISEAFAIYNFGVSLENIKTPKYSKAVDIPTNKPKKACKESVEHDHTYFSQSSTENEHKRKCDRQENENKQVQDENRELKMQNEVLSNELSILKEELNNPKVRIENMKGMDNVIHLHTGLQSYELFMWVLKQVAPAAQHIQYWKGANTAEPRSSETAKRGPQRSLSIANELLLTLMKLKQNINENYLAYLFNVSPSHVSSVFGTWVSLLANVLNCLVYFPSRAEILQQYPACYRRWRYICAVIDCFEIATERPSHVAANTQIFSAYKNKPTVKFLLACTPGGSVSFISQPAGGNMSDKEIVLRSELLDKFSPGDKCLADKGFRLHGEFMERGVELITPPFVKGGKPFTQEENALNKAITHARIHVERVIGRVRDYEYLNGTIPITQLDIVGPAALVCCALTNLKPSVVPQSER